MDLFCLRYKLTVIQPIQVSFIFYLTFSPIHHVCTHFFYKNQVYKNHRGSNSQNIKNLLRIMLRLNFPLPKINYCKIQKSGHPYVIVSILYDMCFG